MKITRGQLQQIIKEELSRAMNEVDLSKRPMQYEEPEGLVIDDIQISPSGVISVDWSWGESFENESARVEIIQVAPLIAGAINDMIEEIIPRGEELPTVSSKQVAKALALRQRHEPKE